MPFIHELSDVQSTRIGENTRIWQFTVVLPGAVIGKNCNICSHTFIDNDVVIGNNVTIKPGVQLWDSIEIADYVFVGPNTTFVCDHGLKSQQNSDAFRHTTLCKGASIGASAIILPGLVIGEHARVQAGAVVTRSVPPNAIVDGNPARIIGYVDASDADNTSRLNGFSAEITDGVMQTKVAGVTLHRFPFVTDMRGRLTVGEFEKTVPFAPKRYFLVLDVPSLETRGEHAHRECHQFLICVRGSCALVADNGTNRQEFLLDRPDIGIHLPPLVWGIQYKHSADAVLLVFASHYYNPADYIRDYSEFCKILGVAA